MPDYRFYSYVDIGLIRCMSVDHAAREPNTPVIIWATEYPMAAWQSWSFLSAGSDHGHWFGFLKSNLSHPNETLVLSVKKGGSDFQNGDQAVLQPLASDVNARMNQMWVVEKVQSILDWGHYILHRESGLALDNAVGSGRVLVWENHGRANQCWGFW